MVVGRRQQTGIFDVVHTHDAHIVRNAITQFLEAVHELFRRVVIGAAERVCVRIRHHPADVGQGEGPGRCNCAGSHAAS